MFRSHVWVPQRKRSNHSPFLGSGARHLFMSQCFWLFGEGGRRGEGARTGPRKEETRHLGCKGVYLHRNVFPKYTNNAPSEKSKRWPKKDHLGGSHEQKQEWWQRSPTLRHWLRRDETPKVHANVGTSMSTLWIPSSCAKAGTTGPVSEFRRLVLRIR